MITVNCWAGKYDRSTSSAWVMYCLMCSRAKILTHGSDLNQAVPDALSDAGKMEHGQYELRLGFRGSVFG